MEHESPPMCELVYLDNDKGVSKEVELGCGFEVTDGEAALWDEREGSLLARHHQTTPLKPHGRLGHGRRERKEGRGERGEEGREERKGEKRVGEEIRREERRGEQVRKNIIR